MYNLKNLQSIVIKKAGKGSIGIVSDKKDYRMEREKNFTLVPLSSLKLFMILLKKRSKKTKQHISSNLLDHFNVENLKLGRFYLLPKIYKRVYDIPGRPEISKCGFYPENVSAFLVRQFKPIAMEVKPYIKNSIDCLKKLRDLQD